MSSHDRVRSALERALGASKVETDPTVCERYARDDSPMEGLTPLAVVHTETTEDIARTLACCTEHNTPVFPRAAGTGRTGGSTVTVPGIVLDCTRMNGIKDVDRKNLTVTVAPGVVLGPMQAMLENEGLFYPPDPQSADQCTLGGNIAENAGGPRAFKYGVTREYVLGLEAVLMNGTVLRTGKRTVKGVTGYDVTALLVGSEGTLAVFTEATLRVLAKPPELRTLLGYFRAPMDAGDAVERTVAAGLVPRCLELLDRECCAAIRAQKPSDGFVLPEGANAVLIAELDGEGPELDRQLQRIGGCFDAAKAMQVTVARNEQERQQLWAARKVMSYALRARAKYKLSEDIVVPRPQLSAMLRFAEECGERNGIVMPAYGHAGDGNLHVNLLWNTPEQRPAVDRAIEELFRKTIALGGTLTGEHGLGLTKRDYLAIEQSNALIQLQTDIKKTLDPKELLNPGKMFPKQGHRAC